MKIKAIFLFGMMLLLIGCDTPMSESNVQQTPRTMIIGGNPVHDHDYQLSTVNPIRHTPSKAE